MARATVTLPFIVWRDGRPQFKPSPRERDLGFRGEDLRHPDGRWFTFEEASAWSAARLAAIQAARATGRASAAPREARTLNALFEELWRSPQIIGGKKRKVRGEVKERAGLAPRTLQDYKAKAKVFMAMEIAPGKTFGDCPVRALSAPVIYQAWEEMAEDRGLSMANGVIAVVRRALTYARQIGWWPSDRANPAFALGLEAPEARLYLWPPAATATIVETADAMGWHSIGTAFVVALHTCQRRGDVLALPPSIFEAERVALTQCKRKAKVDVPMTAILRARVEAERRRLQLRGLKDSPRLIMHEKTGKPWSPHTFGHEFAKVRSAAAARARKAGDDKLAARIEGGLFMDTRDTGITRLALASCDKYQIAAISGHALPTIDAIMKHYLVLTADFADAAIAQLEAWIAREKIAV